MLGTLTSHSSVWGSVQIYPVTQSLSLSLSLPLPGAADSVDSQGWNHLFSQRTYIGPGGGQSRGVSVEQEQDDHREYPATTHPAV